MNITPSSQPLVSFLTVNFHQRSVTMELINSLLQMNYPHWECVIVNNHEPDKVMESELAGIPEVTIISTHKNLGFAGGNNAGLKYCKGDYIYFINNDTEVTPDLLQPIIDLFQNRHGVGMVSSKIVYYFDKKTIQYAGATELNRITTRNRGIGDGEPDNGQFDVVEPTAFVHGASMVVPRKLIEEVGPMYEGYFLYYEEYDWCEQFKRAGYEVWYCGLSKIYHKESVATGVNSPLKVYYLTRNRLLFAKRNFSGLTYMLNLLYFTFLAMPKGILKHLIKGETKQAKAMMRGYIWNINSRNQVS